MCERYSWIETDGAILFLTPNDVFNTKRGKELQAYTTPDDFCGHGAIRFFYLDLQDGENKECTNFSSPNNFPPELALAIKGRLMWGFGITDDMLVMLTKLALAEYEKIMKSALGEYWKIIQPVLAEYQKIVQQAFAIIWENPENRIECWR